MIKKLMVGLAGIALTLSAQAAEEPTLKVGDPAPQLVVTEWVKGPQVPTFEAGNVYLVEFWATW